MLAGRPAFNANSRAATLAATLHDQPSRLKAVRPDVPADLERIVQRCLEKAPDARYASGAGLLDDLVACHAGLAARHVPLRALLRHRGMWAATLVVTSVILAAGVSVWLRQSRVHWARTVALPQAARLIGEGRNYQASRLLLESEAYIADDPLLRDLLSESTTTVTVETVPTGARLEVRDFFSDPNTWETLGHAPIVNRPLAIGPLVWRVSADGFQTIEVVKGTQNPTIQFALDRPEDTPRGMVRVSAGRHESIVRGGAVAVGGMGGGAGPIMTALEPRFKASVLLGGRLYPWRWTSEADPLNFLSRVSAPTLMINGRHDYFFPVETSQRPMFDRLGTPASDKAHRIFESGHVPSERQQFIKEILDWLDKYLGPVS